MATTPIKYRNGLIGTVLFHGLVLFMLLYLAFQVPLPLPVEQGILVDFGNSDKGFGNYEPPMADPYPTKAQPKTPTQKAPAQVAARQTKAANEQTVTQDMEETVALPAKPEKKPKKEETPADRTVKPVDKTVATAKEDVKPAATEQAAPERTVNQRAMYPGRGNAASTATSQGEAGGQGNQGVLTGAPDVHVYGEGGSVGGGGNKWALSGRNLVGKLPPPAYNVQEQGVVVVAITVDKEGNVTKVAAGAKGSTTLNKALLDAAEKAARQTKFSRKPDAIEQTGTITYIFKLNGE